MVPGTMVRRPHNVGLIISTRVITFALCGLFVNMSGHRYDCAHDYAHKDCYNAKGKCRKINLYLDYENALTLADDDINENWEIYREKFLRGDFP
ncbi:MAG: hypothetical protein LWX54_11655 [Deltaproteobacteria bacterium]|nr:hypothetical protein [Deltaproteobacteria bacterium]